MANPGGAVAEGAAKVTPQANRWRRQRHSGGETAQTGEPPCASTKSLEGEKTVVPASLPGLNDCEKSSCSVNVPGDAQCETFHKAIATSSEPAETPVATAEHDLRSFAEAEDSVIASTDSPADNSSVHAVDAACGNVHTIFATSGEPAEAPAMQVPVASEHSFSPAASSLAAGFKSGNGKSVSSGATTKKTSHGARHWWGALSAESCPISLTPIEDFGQEPFGLLAGSEAEKPKEGVWGPSAPAVLKSGQPVHWFDGAFLASFLVSGSNLMDPVNRRSLTRGECLSLDAFLAAHRLPAVHVTESFDLLRSVSSKKTVGGDPGHVAALQREASNVLRSLFDFRRDAAPKPAGGSGALKSGQAAARHRPGPKTGISAGSAGALSTEAPASTAASQSTASQESVSKSDSASSSWPALYQETFSPPSRAPMSAQKMLHREGGLRVVDDTEFEEVGEFNEVGDRAITVHDQGEDPTPAEALCMTESSAVPSSAARAPPRASRGRGAGSRGGSGTGQSKKSAASSAPAAAPILVQVDEEMSNRKVAPEVHEEFKVQEHKQSATSFCDVEVPEWASYELHERTLDELQVAEAMFPDEFELLTPEIRLHLEDCVARQEASSRAEALCFRVLQHVDLEGGDAEKLGVEFSLPPYYPTHSAMVELFWLESSANSEKSLLEVERALRTGALRDLQGSEVVLGVLEWLGEHAVEILDAGVPETALPELERPSVSEEQEDATANAEEALSKQERIDRDRAERMAGKYSESWDLCYAFVKHGCCKDKSCKWRHAIPGKDRR